MRDSYHEELDAITESLVDMANLVGSAMSKATTALLDADLTLAEMVIAVTTPSTTRTGSPRSAPST
jgi:phosphate transport system protein